MSSTCSSRPLQKISSSSEACSLVKDIERVFAVPIDINDIEEKIKECEISACCILKKVEKLTTKIIKLQCAKQKCLFSIRLENFEERYFLKDIQGEHNHPVSKEQLEVKLLTGSLLDYADFIYQTYFLTDSEFCSKPKLILKDLKNKYNIDLLSGNFEQSQRQKLKKKFDNIVQQLRLKKSRSSGDSKVSSNTPIQKNLSAIVSNKDNFTQIPSLANVTQGDQTNKSGTSTPFLCSNASGQFDPSLFDLANYEMYRKQIWLSQASIQTQLQQQNMKQQQFEQFPQLLQQHQTPQLPSQQFENKFLSLHPFQFPMCKLQSNLLNSSEKLQSSEGKQFNQILQVISEDSRSISQCKVEDQSESPEIQRRQELLMSSPHKLLKSGSYMANSSSATTLPISCSTQMSQAINASPLDLGSFQSIGTNPKLQSANILTPPFENSCLLQQPILSTQPNFSLQIQYLLQQQLNNQLMQSLAQQLKYQEQHTQQKQQQTFQQDQNLLLAGTAAISPISQISLFQGNYTNNNINTLALPFFQQIHTESQSSGFSQNHLIPSFQQLFLESNRETQPVNNHNNLSIFPPTISLEKQQDSSNDNLPASSSNRISTLLPSLA